MGIKGLWENLPETEKEQPLMELSVRRGFEVNPEGLRAYRIGIDVSLWFFHARKVAGQTRNGELQVFFHRCCRLLGAPVLPLFVFDGPNRPNTKRNKELKIAENSQLNNIRELIIAFGFECVTAPGEAEAALAQLNAEGIIDAVLSDDVDCFIFGARTVLRSVKGNSRTYMEYINVYDIQTLESSHFSRDELVFIALLRGGDYDPGLTGCGSITATNLRYHGFGKDLVQHWNDRLDSPSAWTDFLDSWRKEVKGKLQPTVANNISDEFPSSEILAAYLNPAIFSAEDLEHISGSLWKSQLNIAKLGRACFNKFQWSTKPKIFERFRSLVWPGAVMRLLLETVRKIDNGNTIEAPFTLVSAKRKPKAHANCASIRLSVAVFENALEDGVSEEVQVFNDTVSLPSRITAGSSTANMTVHDNQREHFWIHRSIIESLCDGHPANEGSPREKTVPGSAYSNGSEDAEDMGYVSSDMGGSQSVIYISSGSD